MNPGNRHEPPSPHPGPPYGPIGHQGPGGSYEPPTVPRKQARRPGRLVPAVVAVTVVLAGGVTGGYVLLSREEPAPAPAPPAKAEAQALDVCTMIPKEETERLVPDAVVTSASRELTGGGARTFTCGWKNDRISHNEYWRSREIEVNVQQHPGKGAKTGRAVAQQMYESGQMSARYAESAKPSVKKGEKSYHSPVKQLPGVGDGAYAQYTFRRDDVLWYSFGEAKARIGDMTVEIRFQAGQQPKEATMLTNKGMASITEENAIREVSGLATHVAKGVTAWQAGNPHLLAGLRPSTTLSPSKPAEASPTPLAAFPPLCQGVQPLALRLVPGGEPRARGLRVGGDEQTECRWMSKEIPAPGGGTKVRSAFVVVHRFTNRAGAGDTGAAKGFYSGQRGAPELEVNGMSLGEKRDLGGLGEAAYRQYRTVRSGLLRTGTGIVTFRKGAVVVEAEFVGADIPKGEALTTPKAVLLREDEAHAGALALAKAFLDGLGAG
ncbi:hypothetical protein [Nonomuraea longicatena]|uniref:DUF3558 domain-containing protein n=1 Tax=Nonomuraea longicatena TaxID=83682 RepID=A0ABP4A8K7_9ACTN